MTLAFEDVNSKLVEVVTVADVYDEDCVGNSLLQIWKLNTLVKILKLKFRRDSEAEVCCLVEVTKLNLGQYSEARYGQDFNFRFSRGAGVWLRF